MEDARCAKNQAQDLQEYTEKAKKYFELPQPEEEGDEPPEIAPVGFVQDLLSDCKVF